MKEETKLLMRYIYYLVALVAIMAIATVGLVITAIILLP